MNVTIIGAGNMGRGIGTRMAVGGHSVTFVDNNPEAAEKVAAEVRGAATGESKVITSSLGEVELGDVVFLAVWYGVNIELVKQLSSRLAGKVVVDIANPLNSSFDGLATALDSSSAEDVAAAAVKGAHVVKAFNTTFAGTLIAGQVGGQKLDVFIAGDDVDAKLKVARLIEDGGMRAIDTGALNHARLIEAMQLAHILLQKTLGTNWMSTIKILS